MDLRFCFVRCSFAIRTSIALKAPHTLASGSITSTSILPYMYAYIYIHTPAMHLHAKSSLLPTIPALLLPATYKTCHWLMHPLADASICWCIHLLPSWKACLIYIYIPPTMQNKPVLCLSVCLEWHAYLCVCLVWPMNHLSQRSWTQWHYDTLHASYTDNYIMAIVQHMHLHVLHRHAFAHIEIHTQSQRTVHGQNKKHIFANQHLAKHVLALCIQLGAKTATSVCKIKTCSVAIRWLCLAEAGCIEEPSSPSSSALTCQVHCVLHHPHSSY